MIAVEGPLPAYYCVACLEHQMRRLTCKRWLPVILYSVWCAIRVREFLAAFENFNQRWRIYIQSISANLVMKISYSSIGLCSKLSCTSATLESAPGLKHVWRLGEVQRARGKTHV